MKCWFYRLARNGRFCSHASVYGEERDFDAIPGPSFTPSLTGGAHLRDTSTGTLQDAF